LEHTGLGGRRSGLADVAILLRQAPPTRRPACPARNCMPKSPVTTLAPVSWCSAATSEAHCRTKICVTTTVIGVDLNLQGGAVAKLCWLPRFSPASVSRRYAIALVGPVALAVGRSRLDLTVDRRAQAGQIQRLGEAGRGPRLTSRRPQQLGWRCRSDGARRRVRRSGPRPAAEPELRGSPASRRSGRRRRPVWTDRPASAGRGLAGSVRPEQSTDLASLHREGELLDRLLTAVAFGKDIGLDHDGRRGHGVSPFLGPLPEGWIEGRSLRLATGRQLAATC
jgi:hypothetical protein